MNGIDAPLAFLMTLLIAAWIPSTDRSATRMQFSLLSHRVNGLNSGCFSDSPCATLRTKCNNPGSVSSPSQSGDKKRWAWRCLVPGPPSSHSSRHCLAPCTLTSQLWWANWQIFHGSCCQYENLATASAHALPRAAVQSWNRSWASAWSLSSGECTSSAMNWTKRDCELILRLSHSATTDWCDGN